MEKSYAREVRSKYGRVLMVADATLKDETGKIVLTLWNEQVKQVMVGNKVKIENGYAKSYRNVLQLSTGRSGKITVIQTACANDGFDQRYCVGVSELLLTRFEEEY